MKVFVSSLITGMEAERAAAKRAIEMLRHQAIMAEAFGARASTPQIACLSGVREADVVVLILGRRYGSKQTSGLSATHEEFSEAQGRKPILTFVLADDAEPDQAAFIQEASSWERGLFRESFKTVDELGDKIARALHDLELSQAVAPLKPEKLRARALSLLPNLRRESSNATLFFAVAAGPDQTILRPAEMEVPRLADALEQHALFGSPPLFDRTLGTRSHLDGDALVIHQEAQFGTGAQIALRESGDLLIGMPAQSNSGSGFSAVIEEDVAAALEASVSFAAWALDLIDGTEKLTHVAMASRLTGGTFFGWRTRAEHAASPQSGSISMLGREDEREAPITLTPAHRVRQALTVERSKIVEDFVVLLRRKWKRN